MDDLSPLDREAARRVVRRASEVAHADDPALDTGGIDVDTLVAAAAEAGIPETDVRRAIALERLGPPAGRRATDRILGAPAVSVDEELEWPADDVLTRLDSWLVSGHHLRRDRLRDGRGVWRRRPGLLAATFRTVRHAVGEGHLGEVQRIEATAVDTGAGTCVVRVTADRRRDRIVRVTAGAAVATFGTVVVAGAAMLTAPAVLLVAPVALVAGAGVAATGRNAAAGVGVEIARVLDAVDHNDAPARLGPDLVRRAVGRAPLPRR